MLRLWVTLYYGYWLFYLQLTIPTVSGQAQTPISEIPSSVWWKGQSVTFYKYRNDGSCRQLALNSTVPNYNDLNGYVGFNQNGAWLGGLDKVTFKLDGTSCVRVSTHRGEYVQMWFQNTGGQACTNGGNSLMGELRYYATPACELNSHQNQIDWMNMGGSIILDGNGCWQDKGVGAPPYAVYYRVYCDVQPPVTQHVFPKEERTFFITNNLTNTIVQPHFVTNNITTYVPTIVKPDDLIPIVKALMAQNASIFKVLSNAPTPPPTPAPIEVPTNKANTQSSAAKEKDALVAFAILWGLLFAACLFG